MEHLLTISMIGLVSGIIGTATGGLAAFLITRITNRSLSFILEFSAGLMTAVVCFELIPEAFELGGASYTLAGVVAGVVTVILLEGWVKNSKLLSGSVNRDLAQAGVLMAIAIALHNFPEGFAVGSGFEASAGIGLTITAVIIIHDIPEGVAIASTDESRWFFQMEGLRLHRVIRSPNGIWRLFRCSDGQYLAESYGHEPWLCRWSNVIYRLR